MIIKPIKPLKIAPLPRAGIVAMFEFMDEESQRRKYRWLLRQTGKSELVHYLLTGKRLP